MRSVEKTHMMTSIVPPGSMLEGSELTPERIAAIRADFPVLQQTVYDKPLVYFDNAATTQKPKPVIDALVDYLSTQNGTVRRGVYYLSEKSTQAFDEARQKMAALINAATPSEVVITRGTTESINLVASTFGRMTVKKGDVIIVSGLEHHANMVPWQQLCIEKEATLKVIPVLDDGSLDIVAYENLIDTVDSIRLIAVGHVSNSLGTINPIKEMIQKAHSKGIPVLVDGAQSIPHMSVDVQDLDCDFYAFSGHKLYGPTGVGALYGKMSHLEAMPPYQMGGDMIHSVSFEKTTFAKPPARFEAGSPAVAEVIGLGVAIDYVQALGLDAIEAYENKLLHYATQKLLELPEVTILGTAPEKAAIISFQVKGVHPHDIGTILDREGVALRAGHHCAQPVMERFRVPATARVSFSFYNTCAEVDTMINAVKTVVSLFND